MNSLTRENEHLKSMSTCQEHEEMIQSLLEEKRRLQLENTELQEEVSLLESKLEGLNKSLRLLNNGTDALDNLLEDSKKGRSKKGIGFDYNSTNKEGQKPKSKLVTLEEKSEFVQINDFQKNTKMSQHVVQHVAPSVRSIKQSTWVCHYCGRSGHLRPYCYRLYGYPKVTSKAQVLNAKVHSKKEWKIKKEESALIAHISLRVSFKEDWYFDSGCSRHMTGMKNYLVDLKAYATSYMTFGDGAKGKIRGIGKLTRTGSPLLDDVLLVEGLTANLIRISQLCDQGLEVRFSKEECLVLGEDQETVKKGARSKDNFYMWMSQEDCKMTRCLLTKEDEVKLWHKKLGHLNLKSMRRIISEEVVRGLPKMKIDEGKICGECQIGKHTKMPHKKLQHLTTTKVLELLHMDLVGPMQVESLGGKKYVFVCVDDFSRYAWINFIREKSDTFDVFRDLCMKVQKEKCCGIVRIRSDHGKEFENGRFIEFCSDEGIFHEFSAPITTQQNGVVERKNRTIQESARVMLHAKNLPYHFWAEAMNTACYILNRVTIRSGTNSTLYEIWKGRKPTVKYFHVFGSKCYILADREQRRKMDPKSEEGIFLGYSAISRAYRVYNLRSKVMMESINVVVDDIPEEKERIIEEDDDLIKTHELAEKSDTGPDVMTSGPVSEIG